MLVGIFNALPAIMITAIVSPIALPIPRIKLARMPDLADGMITL